MLDGHTEHCVTGQGIFLPAKHQGHLTVHVMAKCQHNFLAFIDGYIILVSSETATHPFYELLQLLKAFGLSINHNK